MKRKETYSTTGTRIPVRFFGGWGYPADLVEQRDWVGTAYAQGVPMGADLREAGSKAPTFAVWAAKDPDAANRRAAEAGRRLVTAVHGKPSDLTEMGELLHGNGAQYAIHDGRLSTDIAGTSFEVTLYKVGDKYIAARSNEFGYANYEVEAMLSPASAAPPP